MARGPPLRRGGIPAHWRCHGLQRLLLLLHAGYVWAQLAPVSTSMFDGNASAPFPAPGLGLPPQRTLSSATLNVSASPQGLNWTAYVEFVQHQVQAGGPVAVTMPEGFLNVTSTLIIDFRNATAPIDVSIYGQGITTILDCGGLTSALTILGLTNLDLRSLTIQNCVNTENLGGGGLYVEVRSSITIWNVTFQGNSASSGGAILFAQPSRSGSSVPPIFVQNCFFFQNAATSGGAVAMMNSHGGALFDSCVFQGNTAANGGAFYAQNNSSPVSFTNSFILGNSASADGGGGLYFYFMNGNVTIYNCAFLSNVNKYSGGAIYLLAVFAPVNVVNSTFSSNVAVYGGGIQMYNCFSLLVSGSGFIANTASESGGALYLGAMSGPTVVSQCSFSLNQAQSGGAAMFFNSLSESQITLSNSSFNGNMATADGGALALDVVGKSPQLNVRGSTFQGNNATSGGAAWVSNSNGSCVFDSNVFSNNVANVAGALYFLKLNGAIVLNNNVMFQNTALQSAGGIYFANNTANFSVTNSAFLSNTALSCPNLQAVGSNSIQVPSSTTIVPADGAESQCGIS